jgi:hypothetical protein
LHSVILQQLLPIPLLASESQQTSAAPHLPTHSPTA